MHLHFSKFIFKEGGKKANVRLETFFCKLPMTKIKLSFKEMRQKFLKKVISPHVSQISETTKLQKKNYIIYICNQDLYHYLIPKFLFKSQLWSQEVRRALSPHLNGCMQAQITKLSQKTSHKKKWKIRENTLYLQEVQNAKHTHSALYCRDDENIQFLESIWWIFINSLMYFLKKFLMQI